MGALVSLLGRRVCGVQPAGCRREACRFGTVRALLELGGGSRMTREGNPRVGAQPADPAALKTGLQGLGRGGDKPDSPPDSEDPLYSPLVTWLLPHRRPSLFLETRCEQTSPGAGVYLLSARLCPLVLIPVCGRPLLWSDSGFRVSEVDPGPSSSSSEVELQDLT